MDRIEYGEVISLANEILDYLTFCCLSTLTQLGFR
jgi:hypothetical protein